MWVEMLYLLVSCAKLARHPPREDVSWNAYTYAKEPEAFRHPPREDVSWNSVAEMFVDNLKSHPPREDVSWNIPTNAMHHRRVRHPPREDVSWNIFWSACSTALWVILLVRMWVEIPCPWVILEPDHVILLVRMWVEMTYRNYNHLNMSSSSSWGCELK